MSQWEWIVVGTAVALGVAGAVFWIWMLVDCLRHETPREQSRLVWALVIVFAKLIGATVYYFVRFRPRRIGSAEG